MEFLENLEKWADPRSKDWFLVVSFPKTLAMITTYILFCTVIGPALMKNRKPFKIDRFVQFYNLAQITLSIYNAIQVMRVTAQANYNFICDPLCTGTDYLSIKILEYHWLYLFIKFIDFGDTIFFVMRKKYNQISYLHLHHHASMFLVSWVFIRYFPGGQIALTSILNSIVHTFMYIYYLIASFGPEYKKYLWWKKNITQMQIVQFLILGVHSLAPFFYDCGYPKLLTLVITFQSVTFLYLFTKFYINTYMRKSTVNRLKTN